MRIWKYELEVEDFQLVEMPEGAKLLSVQMQRGTCCLWALVDPSKPKESRSITIYGTGHPMPDNPGTFVGTFQTAGGKLVLHVFDA